jgi:hypothetical protein
VLPASPSLEKEAPAGKPARLGDHSRRRQPPGRRLELSPSYGSDG